MSGGSRWGETKIERWMSESVSLAIFTARIEMAKDEDACLAAVIELAQWYGWRLIHIRPARTSQGWRTPVQGDGVGFPDIFAIRRTTKQRFSAEMKFGKNVASAEQTKWLSDMEACGIPAFTWWPESIDEIKDVLKNGAN